MSVIEINDISQPELAPFVSLTENKLRNFDNDGLIIVESPKVIATALENGLQPVALLCEKKHISGDASFIIEENPSLPVYTGERELLRRLTGYTLTRGVLCAMIRPKRFPTDEILRNAERVCVLYDICDTTNVGAIFRTAAALAFDAVILSEQNCDPFNRRAIRVSMGAVFQIPWCYEKDIMKVLREQGFISVSMALSHESKYLQDFIVLKEKKYAVIFGSEGYGLPEKITETSDEVVKIPMKPGVDSLNVGAAAAITMWYFSQK